MVGLGGGFIIVPVLRIAFGLTPAAAAGTSLALVVANSASAATTYLLQRRVDVRLGLLLAAGGLPGSILGAIAVAHLAPRVFDWAFAALLIGIAADILFRRRKLIANQQTAAMPRGMAWPNAIVAGFGVGLVSSLFGVGGGVVLVPILIYASTLPAHAISATSQFGILLTAPVGFLAHLAQRDIDWNLVLPLVAGGALGGPLGARLSLRLDSARLMVLVAAALIAAALALVLRHFI